jgi:Fe-S cluster assembly iron-binding protein IscA
LKRIILNEVVVNPEKAIDAEDIVTKARNIELNYYQDPYNQKFYFRNPNIKKNKITSKIAVTYTDTILMEWQHLTKH